MPRQSFLRLSTILLSALGAPGLHANNTPESGWSLSLLGIYVTPDNDRFDIDYGAGARVALGRPISAHWDLELAGFGNLLDRDERSGKDWQYGLGADLLGYLNRDKQASLYGIIGGGGLYNDYDGGSTRRPYANAGAGIVFREIWNRMALRIEARHFVDWAHDSARNARYDETRFYIGLEIPLFPTAQPAPKIVNVTKPTQIIERERVTERLPELQILDGVSFALDSAELEPNARVALRQTARQLTMHPEVHVEVAGHTCNLGNEEYNMRLSLERARSVRAFLISEGVSPARIHARGYGESEPMASNTHEEGRRQNRRIELRRLDQHAVNETQH